jgi:hypothetical protein
MLGGENRRPFLHRYEKPATLSFGKAMLNLNQKGCSEEMTLFP